MCFGFLPPSIFICEDTVEIITKRMENCPIIFHKLNLLLSGIMVKTLKPIYFVKTFYHALSSNMHHSFLMNLLGWNESKIEEKK